MAVTAYRLEQDATTFDLDVTVDGNSLSYVYADSTEKITLPTLASDVSLSFADFNLLLGLLDEFVAKLKVAFEPAASTTTKTVTFDIPNNSSFRKYFSAGGQSLRSAYSELTPGKARLAAYTGTDITIAEFELYVTMVKQVLAAAQTLELTK